VSRRPQERDIGRDVGSDDDGGGPRASKNVPRGHRVEAVTSIAPFPGGSGGGGGGYCLATTSRCKAPLEVRVEDSEFRVEGLRFRVQDLGIRT